MDPSLVNKTSVAVWSRAILNVDGDADYSYVCQIQTIDLKTLQLSTLPLL